MASLQPRTTKGHKYWSIVESRRVNGKPTPFIIQYLGTADALLKRLNSTFEDFTYKSYSHGSVVALLDIAAKIGVPDIINQHIDSQRPYFADKPLRNDLTAGVTLLLAAIGRVCKPTSKDGWWNWAQTTSLEYLLKVSLNKLDSSHYWDMMDSLPVENIEKIEVELLQRIKQEYNLESNTLLFDTTNFFTYISSTNARCEIAKRGKNKQRRYDLRQFGLALVVTKKDNIPIFHHTYEGNMNDSKVFDKVIGKIRKRLVDLDFDLNKHTIVFDRGNNSKKNLALLKELELFYVGALTPYHHKELLERANENFEAVTVKNNEIQVYREKSVIWGGERTILVIISEKLRAGQLRGIYQALSKKEKQLQKLAEALDSPKAKKRDREKLEEKLRKIAKGQFLAGIIDWTLTEKSEGKFKLTYTISKERIAAIEEELGFRILMTNRHSWDSSDIIDAYHSQAAVEASFKDLKNPFNLAVRPQYHWTDQKLKVHNFICVMGYQLATILLSKAREKAGFTGSMQTLLTTLNNIRLALVFEKKKKKNGNRKVTYKLEELSKKEEKLMSSLGLQKLHKRKIKMSGVGVYK